MSKGKTIGIWVSGPELALLESRGKFLEKSPGEVVKALVTKWATDGAPPVSDLERKLLRLNELEKAGKL